MRILLAAVVAALARGQVWAQRPAPAESLAITFLANEGVMLSSGGKKVLIDALFLKYQTGYAVPADSTQAALAAARAPFDATDLVLVTHRHGDHFHPEPVAAHLRANPRAVIITSQQVIDSLQRNHSASALRTSQIVSRTTAPGTRRREIVNGVTVELLGLPHTGTRHRGVEHLGYIVELGGRRVLHVGDTDGLESSYATFRLDTARIDVALLPAWMVTSEEGRRVIDRWIRPRHVVAIHLPDGDAADRVAREVRAALPQAIAFTRSLEARRW